jgi:MoxR-like ATPase
MLEEGKLYVGASRNPDDSFLKQEFMSLRYANRHGLITGATGTGKTVSLQILARVVFQCRRSRLLRRRQRRSVGHCRKGEARTSS